jgi:transcriptional regulator with XRE-family HTH domain
MIYQLRTEANLNQKELADLVGTTQSVISRLEDSEYEGHSLGMLEKITKALGHKLRLATIPQQQSEHNEMHLVFQKFITALRKKQGLTLEAFAKKLEINKEMAIAIESDPYFKSPPLILHKLAKLFEIPSLKLNALAGATKEMPDDLRAQASRFAAKAESFVTLTTEEKKSLDEFMKVLRSRK